MKKYIIREVETPDFSFYFDDDGLTEASGEWCNNLFIVSHEGWGRFSGFNIDTYREVMRAAENIITEFSLVGEWRGYGSYRDAMEDFGISYNSHKCHSLKEWAKDADATKTEDIAEFLSIVTGKKWETCGVCGYSQGDYVELVYCPERYKNGVKHYGEIWLGCGKEFCVIEVDGDGEEIDSCYGYIVADCEAWQDEEYKRLVCAWAGIDEAEAQLEMIDGYTTVTHCSYRIA